MSRAVCLSLFTAYLAPCVPPLLPSPAAAEACVESVNLSTAALASLS